LFLMFLEKLTWALLLLFLRDIVINSFRIDICHANLPITEACCVYPISFWTLIQYVKTQWKLPTLVNIWGSQEAAEGFQRSYDQLVKSDCNSTADALANHTITTRIRSRGATIYTIIRELVNKDFVLDINPVMIKKI
jgi:hypothetical protein